MKRVQITFGGTVSQAKNAAGGINFILGAPVLGDAPPFTFLLPEGETYEEAGGLVHDSGDLVVGLLRGAEGIELESSTGRLYDRMFRYVGGRFLYRVWHFVPRINAWETPLENYRLFCRGRADAFSRNLGGNCFTLMPAASAVGSVETEPVMLFVAGKTEPRHAENPEQVPAYRYPPVYGPRSPSFARASRVGVDGGEVVFISGTASIKGSETMHPDDCEKQVAVTLHNLSLIGERSGLGANLTSLRGGSRRFVVYLRREEDFPRVEALLQQDLFEPGDETVFLLTDICRADLSVEIEATVFIPAPDVPPPA